ncbi:hypothetical protein E4U54_002789 [Claviceps lovelessii]|nr:hypothetical protein E4U54_002789 [Claviceps lovelessii]
MTGCGGDAGKQDEEARSMEIDECAGELQPYLVSTSFVLCIVRLPPTHPLRDDDDDDDDGTTTILNINEPIMTTQQQQQQQNLPPAHPQDTYQAAPMAQTSDNTIQPVPQALPPPYDQAKNSSQDQSPQGQNQNQIPQSQLPQYQNPQAQNYPQNAQPIPTVIPLNQLSDQPQWIDCPFCHKRAMTVVRREGTSMQIVIGAVLCLVCVCLTCLPCLAGWFEDTQYRCSSCNSMVALRRYDGPLEVLGPQVPVYSQYSGNQAPMVDQQQQQQQQQYSGIQQQPPQQPPQQPQQQHELHEIQPQPQHQDATAQPPTKS